MIDKRRKWITLSGQTVFENRWIEVKSYKTIAPTGAAADYGLVHIRNLAIGVLPIDEGGYTYLVGQERFAFDHYSWELPEGGGSRDVPPLETAKRELAEETGLSAGRWRPLLEDVHLSNSLTDERAYAFLAWDLTAGAEGERDSTEDLSIRRLHFREAVEMAVSGEISDAFSLMMLLKADYLARTGALPESLAQLLLSGG
ncbi:MAG: NUDIX hydrolase [Alphaproteobacteria bacterium]|nr:NUDIX hydrolase [Alphaproteobacteria bacterium]